MNQTECNLLGSKRFLPFTLNNEQPAIMSCNRLKNGTKVELWDTGVLHFQPPAHQVADSIVLSAGVHGNETAPIEMLDQLVSDIFQNKIDVTQNLLVILANPPAIKLQTRFVDENMNRLFQPEFVANVQDNPERQRAFQLMRHTKRFFAQGGSNRFHYDLHTAIRDSAYRKFAVSPNASDSQQTQAVFSFLKRCDIEAILITDKTSTTYSAYTSQTCGATSFTLELGKVMPFGENDLTELSALTQGLQTLISGKKTNQSASKDHPALFRVAAEVLKQTDHFRLRFAKEIANFTEFAPGDVLATDQNYEYRVTEPGERIVFPNQDVAIGQRALVIVKPI